MEPYPSGQFGFIDDPDRQSGNGAVQTRTWTRSDSPEPLLTLLTMQDFNRGIHYQTCNSNLNHPGEHNYTVCQYIYLYYYLNYFSFC